MTQDRKCPSCGATLTYNPGFNTLTCASCGYKETIAELVSKVPVEEKKFAEAESAANTDWGMETEVATCKNCGGVTIQSKLQLSGMCPFCGSTMVEAQDPAEGIMAPMGVIPFKITEKRAGFIYKDWLKDRFLAPELLDENSRLDKFYPLYIPLYTFDVLTDIEYDARLREGFAQVPRRGQFRHQIDDFPVVASKTLTSNEFLMRVAKDFRSKDAKPYTPDALAGFPCEHYSISLKDAWNNIGGDLRGYFISQILKESGEPLLSNIKTNVKYYDLKYKYIIAPIWLNSFIYEGKRYLIAINGQTGTIDGKWPMSFGTFAKKAASFILDSYGL
ncbi:MAG: hypothetical protein K5745_03920 [Saccharofermentans sp.]|nr:hypothetical protein [Saccharofermentans sp.]